MNFRRITGVVLAVALTALAVEAAVARQPVEPNDEPITTLAPNAGFDDENVVAMNETNFSARDAANPAAAAAKFGWCSTLTFSTDGHDTAMSSNQFADPFLGAATSFVCHTY